MRADRAYHDIDISDSPSRSEDAWQWPQVWARKAWNGCVGGPDGAMAPAPLTLNIGW